MPESPAINKVDTKLMAPRNGIEMRVNSPSRLLPNRDRRGDSHKHLFCTFADNRLFENSNL